MSVKKTQLLANQIRKDIVIMLNNAKSGHTGGSLGMADLFAVLYGDFLNFDSKRSSWKERDFVFLSNGHVCPVLYSTLANFGYFQKEELMSLRKLNSRLQGHPHYGALPGVENSGGPLGQGVSQAVGLAASLKRDKKNNKVFCFVGDGEIQEGQCWEAFLFAAKEKLDNLYFIIDRNHIQIDGSTEDVIGLGDLGEKLSSFGLSSVEFNGNDVSEIKHVLEHSFKIKDKPTALIALTTMGKGISFMQDDYHWHGKVPNDDELDLALKELDKIEEGLK